MGHACGQIRLAETMQECFNDALQRNAVADSFCCFLFDCLPGPRPRFRCGAARYRPPSVPAEPSSDDVIDTLGSAPADSTGSRESLVRELSTTAESGGLRAVLADPPDVGGTSLGGLSGLA